MGYTLCIAEKPSVGKDIARVIGADNNHDGYLEGNGYIVTWAAGHLVGLAEPEIYGFVPQKTMYTDDENRAKACAELPLVPSKFRLVVLDRTKNQFDIVKRLLTRPDVDLVIDCGDMGAEGHILQWFIREKAGCKKPVKRFCATSMTDEAIKAAMANLRPIGDFEGIIRGEFCKKKADWILGMSLSRAASLKHRTGINVGRVQSPTLYFVVKRYLDVIDFKPMDYYTLKAELYEGFDVFYGDRGCVDKAAAMALAAGVESSKTGVISALETKKAKTERPQLYDITELERDANIRYGYTAAQTLEAAQTLYETYKVLSYPRTDSRYITTDLVPYMVGRVQAIGGQLKYADVASRLLNDGLIIDKRVVDDLKVTDHHALIPTELIHGFDLSRLDEVERNVLELVLCRVLVALSTPYIYERTTVSVTFQNGAVFTASGNKALAMGWRAACYALLGKDYDPANTDERAEQIPPNLISSQTVTAKCCTVVERRTAPPELHTEASILTAMESSNLGTQATRASIIKKLFDTGMVENVKKEKVAYIQPTAKGLGVIRALPPELYSPKMTADWEAKIAQIAGNNATDDDFMRTFIAFIQEKTREVLEDGIDVSFRAEREVHGVCPWCGGDIFRYKRDEDTRFYCSQECGFGVDCSDKVFARRLGRKLTDAEAKRLIANGGGILTCKKASTGGVYDGRFTFARKEYSDRVYCNIECEAVFGK